MRGRVSAWSAYGSAGALALVAATALAAGSPVNIETTFDQDIAGLDQTLQLTVKITVHGGGSVDRLELPHSPSFQVAGTSKSEQTSIQMGGGGIDTSHTTLYRISLRPLKLGDWTFTPAELTVGGKAYKGTAVHVKVVASGQGPAPQARRQQQQSPFGGFFGQALPPGFPQGFSGEPDDSQDDPFAQLFGGGRQPSGEDVILGASVDSKKVVLGQQLIYTIRLYTRADVSEFSELKLPGFDGFWGEEIETPARPLPKVQNLGGVPYQVYLIKKKALFPDRAGTLTIGAAELDVTVGLGFFRGRKMHRESAPIKIEVSPLPAGAPPSFPATNVGGWQMSSKLTPASVPVGEPATFTMLVEGYGNLHSLTLPALPAIPGLRAYDPTSTDKVTAQGERFAGRRQVDTILIPQRTGDFELPQLTFHWYDPQTGYQSTTTPKLTLHAVIGAGGAGTGGAAPAGQNVLEASFRPPRNIGGLIGACASGVHGLPAPLSGLPLGLGLGLPPVTLLLASAVQAIRRRRSRQAGAIRGRRAYRVARGKLDAGASLTAADTALALFGYLDDRMGETMNGLSFPDLRQRLLARGVDEATVRSTLAALELAESLRYMPPSGVQAQEIARLRTMAEFALESLERASVKKGRAPKSKKEAA